MLYNNQIRVSNNVVYMDSPTDGFTCVDLEKTPKEAIYCVDYDEFTKYYHCILYTTRKNRPAFLVKDGEKLVLHVNDLGEWYISEIDHVNAAKEPCSQTRKEI